MEKSITNSSKKNLSVYVNLNVEIIDPLSDTLPDVVITNLNNLYQEEQSKVMVWLDPPRSIDWVNLTQSLLTIQEEKYQQQKNRQRQAVILSNRIIACLCV